MSGNFFSKISCTKIKDSYITRSEVSVRKIPKKSRDVYGCLTAQACEILPLLPSADCERERQKQGIIELLMAPMFRQYGGKEPKAFILLLPVRA